MREESDLTIERYVIPEGRRTQGDDFYSAYSIYSVY